MGIRTKFNPIGGIKQHKKFQLYHIRNTASANYQNTTQIAYKINLPDGDIIEKLEDVGICEHCPTSTHSSLQPLITFSNKNKTYRIESYNVVLSDTLPYNGYFKQLTKCGGIFVDTDTNQEYIWLKKSSSTKLIINNSNIIKITDDNNFPSQGTYTGLSENDNLYSIKFSTGRCSQWAANVTDACGIYPQETNNYVVKKVYDYQLTYITLGTKLWTWTWNSAKKTGSYSGTVLSTPMCLMRGYPIEEGDFASGPQGDFQIKGGFFYGVNASSGSGHETAKMNLSLYDVTTQTHFTAREAKWTYLSTQRDDIGLSTTLTYPCIVGGIYDNKYYLISIYRQSSNNLSYYYRVATVIDSEQRKPLKVVKVLCHDLVLCEE